MTTDAVAMCALCGAALGLCEGLRARWKLLLCKRCGHVESPAALLTSDAAEALQRRYFAHGFAGEKDAWARRMERHPIRHIRRLIVSRCPPPGRCLEIGPGSGALLRELRYAGYFVSGLEISESVAATVEGRAGGTIHVGSVAWHVDNGGRSAYRIVVMRHVLEHMTEPTESLRAVRSMLITGGMLYVAVPNIEALEAMLPGWTGYQPYHLHYFTKRTLARTLAAAGFHVDAVRSREPASGWVNAVVNSVRGSTDGAWHDGGAGYPSRILAVYNAFRLIVGGGVFWPLRAIQAHLGRGEELEAVAYAR